MLVCRVSFLVHHCRAENSTTADGFVHVVDATCPQQSPLPSTLPSGKPSFTPNGLELFPSGAPSVPRHRLSRPLFIRTKKRRWQLVANTARVVKFPGAVGT